MQTVQLLGPVSDPAIPPERTDENGRVYAVTHPSFTVYPADPVRNQGTAIIICPGGGYYLLDMRAHVERVAPIFNRAGITVFGLKYRLWPPSSNAPADALADIQAAMRVIRSRAKEWRMDTNRLGVLGYSAGSNLALRLLHANDVGNPTSLDPLGRFSTKPDFVIQLCPWAPSIADLQLPRTTPPTYIARAEDDEIATVAIARHIKAELDGLGVPAELKTVPCGGHNGFNFSQSAGTSEVPWTEDVLAWLTAQQFL